MLAHFANLLSDPERELWLGLDSPAAIQAFLDRTPYSPEDANRCPLQVLGDGLAHCLDGALFAAAALWQLGYPPLVIDLFPEPETDDDHVLAVYQIDGHWGAVAKSNYVGLRFREAIYRDLRELALSYFEAFYNLYGEKTLRAYTRPLNLTRHDKTGWLWRQEGADVVYKRLLASRPIPLLTPAMAGRLSPMDKLSYEAMMQGVNLAGVYQPGKHAG